MKMRIFVVFIGLLTCCVSLSYADIASTKYVDDKVPTVNDGQLTIVHNGITDTWTSNSGTNKTITITDNNTTYSAMTGATSGANGAAGLVPAPAAGKQGAFLRGDGTWAVPDTGDSVLSKIRIGETGSNLADMWIE